MSNPKKLFNKNFALLWQGQLVSQIGSQAFSIATLFWTKNQTNSATLVGVLLMLAVLPQVLLSPLGGTFADRYSRKKIIVACDLISGIFMVSLAVAFFFFPESNNTLFIGLLTATLVISAVRSFFGPAVYAAIPDIVPSKQVPAANSSLQILVQISALLGTGIGGILFRLLGAPLLFLLNGISYLFSGFLSSFINIRKADIAVKSAVSSIRQETLEGFQYIFGNAGLRASFYVFALLNFFITPISVILPYYVEDVLALSADWYGYIASAFGVGAIIGYVLVAWLKPQGTVRRNAVLFAFFCSACLLFSLSTVYHPIVALICFAILGILNGFTGISLVTQIQTCIKPEMRGRVMGNFMTLTGVIIPISLGISGILIDVLNKNVLMMLMVCGIALGALSASLLLNRNFLKFLVDNAQPMEQELVEKGEETLLVATKDYEKINDQ